MKKNILQLISQKQLTSCMNNTKWKELVFAITSNKDFDPPVKIKYLLEEEAGRDFSPVWWDEVEQIGFEAIEWMQIRPWREDFVGRLIKPRITDHSLFIQQSLEQHHIPYELETGLFTIYGYKRTGI